MIWLAEIGINHHGDFEKAKRMCSKAVDAGATLIKGQYYNPKKVLGLAHPDLQYAESCQFTKKQHEELYKYCSNLGIPYSVSVFCPQDVSWVDGFAAYHKIASRMNINAEFIYRVEGCKKPTYMSVQPELGVRIPKRFKLLWCVRKYPSSKEDILGYPYKGFGLSSHCPDITATLEAIKQGAEVVEHHLCESKEEKGCDISSSINFEELKHLIESANRLAAR